jgi:hypothetical protein
MDSSSSSRDKKSEDNNGSSKAKGLPFLLPYLVWLYLCSLPLLESEFAAFLL